MQQEQVVGEVAAWLARRLPDGWFSGPPEVIADGERLILGLVVLHVAAIAWYTLRKRQVKNFCALLFLSNGTPMFRAGDEFLQTQHGNNNPYNQDNETTWLDWKNRDCALEDYAADLAARRIRRPAKPLPFLDELHHRDGGEELGEGCEVENRVLGHRLDRRHDDLPGDLQLGGPEGIGPLT